MHRPTQGVQGPEVSQFTSVRSDGRRGPTHMAGGPLSAREHARHGSVTNSPDGAHRTSDLSIQPKTDGAATRPQARPFPTNPLPTASIG